MEHFIANLTRPDNIPTVLLVLLLAIHLWIWWRQVRVHDRLIREGREDEVLEEMKR